MLKKLCIALLLILMTATAAAEPAQDVTKDCVIHVGERVLKKKEMLDRKYTTYASIKKGGVIAAQHPSEDLSGVFVQFYDHPGTMDVQARQDSEWVSVGSTAGTYLCEWIPLPEGCREVRLVNQGKGRVLIAELTIYGQGDRPARSPQWRTLDKADIMVLAAHPDDELLWFAGLLPTYAAERGMAVQVVYMVPSTPNRRLELLDGLWHCGVDAYPMFGGMSDAKGKTLQAQYKKWNRGQMLSKVVTMVRRVQPEVLVSHDVNGEYGHGAHRACADIAKLTMKYAADKTKYRDSAKAYGPWQVKKLYLHLYKERQLRMNWRIPLDAFDGKDSYTVAEEALAFHQSQVRHGWGMEEGGKYDNALLGLAFTTVGEDVDKDDLLENIPAECLTVSR